MTKYSPADTTSVLNTGVNSLLPKRVIRLRYRDPVTGVNYPLFYGFIETITPHPHLTQQDAFISAIDGMDFLARHELDTILYKDKLTGYLVNEIADSAYGNLLTNGNFEDGDPPTGWSNAGECSATSVERSDEQVKVGVYSVKITAVAPQTPFFYQKLAGMSGYVGSELTLGAWVWASVSDRVKLQLRFHDAGDGAISMVSGDPHSGDSDWEFLTVTATVPATTVYVYARCTQDPTATASYYVDGAILVEGSKCPPGKLLDAGQDTVPFAHWHKVKARFALEELEDSELGFIIIDGSGNLRWEDRHHRFSVTHQTSQATFDDTMENIFYDFSAKKVFNEIRATVTPWELKTAAELWRLEEVPSIAIGETITLWGNFEFFADEIDDPVGTNDYLANSQADGGGDDETGNVTITTFSKFAKAAKLVIRNDALHTVYITYFRIMGTYYDSETKLSRKSEDITSQGLYQKRTLPLDGKYLTDADLAQNYCDYALARFKDPQADVIITLVNKNSTLLTQILTREISDRITVYNTKLGLIAPSNIGSTAIDRATNIGHSHTLIDLTNPAISDFTIVNVEIWAQINITGMRVGTFYSTGGTNYKCRDSELIGNVTAGSKQIFGVSLQAQTGDFIGCYLGAGAIDRDNIGGNGVMYINSEQIDIGDEATYTLLSNYAISLHATASPTGRDYFINKMEHEILEGGELHRCRWYLVDAENEDFWIIEHSKLNAGTKISY